MSDKTLIFLEDKMIGIIITFLVILTIGNYILIITTAYGLNGLNSFLLGPFQEALSDKEGTLSTIAAIFIGIYITVFSLLGSIKIDSTFSKLSQNNFEKLLKYIKLAFIAAFSFLFFSIIAPTLTSLGEHTENIIGLLGIVLINYMFLTALRFAVIIFISYQRDLSKIKKDLEDEKRTTQQNKLLLHRLEKFLSEIESEKAKRNATEISKVLKEREKNS